MSIISKKFAEIFKSGKTALMTHIIVGYPNLATSEKLVLEMAGAGTDFIEMQIPFSEPIADGPVFFDANQEVLKNNIKVKDAFELMTKVSQKITTPLLFMTYYNIIFKYGLDKFCAAAKKAGCCGLIIPDVPPEEAHEYLKKCHRYKLAPIFIITPNTPDERIKKICGLADGFIYCVGRTGVTGGKTKFGTEFQRYMKKIRRYTNLPLGVGFGVRTKEDVTAISKYAEMSIVGTAVTQSFREQGIEGVRNLVKVLKS